MHLEINIFENYWIYAELLLLIIFLFFILLYQDMIYITTILTFIGLLAFNWIIFLVLRKGDQADPKSCTVFSTKLTTEVIQHDLSLCAVSLTLYHFLRWLFIHVCLHSPERYYEKCNGITWKYLSLIW